MKTLLTLAVLSLAMPVIVRGQDTVPGLAHGSCPRVHVEAERLPDLNIPRGEHTAYCTGDEIVVLGGHTSGFVPTPTAEYYAGGQWHQIPMTYAHDHALSLQLSSGKILIGGGQEEALGVGQTFSVETYDPAAHTCQGFGCLELKRTLANGVELDSGRVVVSGNWYYRDGIELFDGKKYFTYIKDVSAERATPYIFRTARDNALIVGSMDTRGNFPDSIVVDQLHGEPFCPPLLHKWKPLRETGSYDSHNSFIGDVSKDIYAYLMPVTDTNRNGYSSAQADRLALALVQGVDFSLLPTTVPIPMETEIGGYIYYKSALYADRKSQRAYLMGVDREKRFYVLCVAYAQRPAPLTLYYTDPLPECGFGPAVLTADGNIVITGGYHKENFYSDNFFPVSSVWLIHLGGGDAISQTTGFVLWHWLVGGIWGLLMLAVGAMWLYRHRRMASPTQLPDEAENAKSADSIDIYAPTQTLIQRIRGVVETERLFLNAELKVSDVAARLGTNTRYVADCLKSEGEGSFPQYISRLRVEYAQQLIRRNPDKKMATVCIESGFVNEVSFFRTFKAFTGMTPKEWAQQILS
ncbi:MAG: helix-turn-helix domain-containing protein [Bacteroidaceae bacterium]|nr:helix-turn-helix domain-containing protein [Bacteroidaceae bacterium]